MPTTATTPRSASLSDTAPEHASKQENLLLACICACTALVIALVASINLAVPMLASSSLHPSSSQLLWIVDAYVIVFACLVIPAGAFGDRFGRKGALVAGLCVLGLGSLVSGLSSSVAVMLAGRVITGMGAALVLPNALAVLLNGTRPAHRSRAIAIWAGASGVGGVIGNVGGGALLAIGSWRPLFLTATPLAWVLVAWVATAAKRSPRTTRALDPIGSVLLVATAVTLLLAIINGPEHGWVSAHVIIPALASACLAAAWVVSGLRSSSPILDPRLFTIGSLSTACLGMVTAFFGNFGLFYINASLMQYGRGYSVLETGLGILPLSVPMIIGTRYVPKLTTRFGAAMVLFAAFITTAVGLLGLALTARHGYLPYALFLVVVGIGVTLALPCLTALITASIPPEQAGVAGGLQSATREFGSALGVAVVGSILTSSFTAHLPHAVPHAARTVAEALHTAPKQHAAIISAFTTGASHALIAAAIIVLIIGMAVSAVMRSRNTNK